MTVPANNRRKVYEGDGVTVTFNGPMAYSPTHIQTSLVDIVTGNVTSAGSFTVERLGKSAGTIITMAAAPPSGFYLVILLLVPYSQTVDITNQGSFNASVLEQGLDLLEMQIGQNADDLGRSPRLGEFDIDGVGRYDGNGNRLGGIGVALEGDDVPTLSQVTGLIGPGLGAFMQAGAGATARQYQDKAREVLSVRDFFGTFGNGVALNSAVSIASGSGALTVSGANFQTTDIGKVIAVRGAGVAGATLYALISSRTSTTQVGLSANASTALVASTQRVVYGSDDSLGFQQAIDSLPSEGGTILVPDGIYMIQSAAPNSGTKSIQWDIKPGVVFDGALGGSTNLLAFPRANTNESIVPFGPFIQLRTSTPPEGPNTLASTAGLFEALQPASHDGNAVALYAGARSAAPAGLLWATNFLAQADLGFAGSLHGIELDINNFTGGTVPLTKGLGISGIGNAKATVAIEVQHGVGWERGVDLLNCDLGIQIRTSCALGISVFAPAGGAGTVLTAKQKANGNETLHLERFTDAAPTGSFIRARNAANGADLFNVGVDGSVTAAGIASAAGFSTTGTVDTFNALLRFAAPAGAAGSVGLGNGTGTTVGGAGGASALPATPLLYWHGTFNGVAGRIPVYPA